MDSRSPILNVEYETFPLAKIYLVRFSDRLAVTPIAIKTAYTYREDAENAAMYFFGAYVEEVTLFDRTSDGK